MMQHISLVLCIVSILTTDVVDGQFQLLRPCDFCGGFGRKVQKPDNLARSPFLKLIGKNNEAKCGDIEAALRLPFTPVGVCATFQGDAAFKRICGCGVPTTAPTRTPTKIPQHAPTRKPSTTPTRNPTRNPTKAPVPTTSAPTFAPVPVTSKPTRSPTRAPIAKPTSAPVPVTLRPSRTPTKAPVLAPSNAPILAPSKAPASAIIRTPVAMQNLVPALIPLLPFILPTVPTLGMSTPVRPNGGNFEMSQMSKKMSKKSKKDSMMMGSRKKHFL